MEFLDKLKSMVGVGAPTLTLTALPGPVRSGQLLRSSVVLQGGDYDAPVKDVQVRLEEERLAWPAPGRPERQFWRHLAEVVIGLDGRELRQGELINTAVVLLGRPEAATLLAPAVARISWILKDDGNRELDSEHFDPPFLLPGDRLLGRLRNPRPRSSVRGPPCRPARRTRKLGSGSWARGRRCGA